MGYTRPAAPTQLPDWRLKVLDDPLVWDSLIKPITIAGDDQAFHNMRAAMKEAVMWWVGVDCCDLLTQVAPSMPPVTLSVDMVPDTHGFAFFEEPITGVDAWNPARTIHFDALQWYPTIVASVGLLCITVAAWSFNETYNNGYPTPLGYSDWPYGVDTDHVEGVPADAVPSIIEDRQLLAALWQLSSQPNLTATGTLPLYRAQAKRVARKGLEPAPVRLVNLNRKPRRPTGRSSSGDREYSHRWIVRPFWRQQPYGPNRALRKAILIDQHIRGPADKPLRVRDTVKVWTRRP